MPKDNQQPDPNRRQTRATNATAHPGLIVMEAQRRQKKEDIEGEKKTRNELRKAREEKRASKRAVVMDIAEFENQMALDDRSEETTFPRHQIEGIQSVLLT